jgi:DNA-binding transcriptional LysR family regulator
MQIIQFAANSNALAVGTLTAFERELLAGEIVPLPIHDQASHAHYGFISLKERSLPPAVEAYMHEVRAVEEEVTRRERELAELTMK